MDRTRISSALVRTEGSSPTVHAMRSGSFYLGKSSKLKKVNGYFWRSHDHPVLVIPPTDVMEDIEYWTKHALICKYLGIHISLSALEAWIHRSWQVEGDMEIMLGGNSYFLLFSLACLTVIMFLKEALIFTTMWGYLSNLGIQDLILLKISLQ